ncbi:MAG: NADH-quinone oxidoreductase subunit M [Alphaproteobacteria bacterium]|jgi:NADH-quinone oxidoreductase subunit M
MLSFPWLSLTVFFPFLGVIFILLFGNDKTEQGKFFIKASSLSVSIITFIITLVIALNFVVDEQSSAYGVYQFVEQLNWFKGLNIQYHLGVDAISLPFVLLTSLLTIICILCSWNSITVRVKEYYMLFLLLETLIFGVFLSLDILQFYIFFEAVLIPMFIIIGVWGAEDRIYAAVKFFLYTLAGSVLFLLAVIYIYIETNTTNMVELTSLLPQLPLIVQKFLWAGFFLGFAIKVPMWPVHTWLPDAHVQAPTAGSVILAGILLKLGAYGFIRFSLAMLPEISYLFRDFIFVLSSAAIIYASLVAFAQTNMKKLIAYSSIAHMGYVTNGIFAANIQGLQGAIMQSISHGLISAALFICVGVLYDRAHTKEIAEYGGVAEKMPLFAVIFMFFTLGSIALPGTSGFVGELLSLIGLYNINIYYAIIATTGMIFGAVYMLWLYGKVMLGVLNKTHVKSLVALNNYEVIIFIPLILIVLLLGVYPSILTDLTKTTFLSLINYINFYA